MWYCNFMNPSGTSSAGRSPRRRPAKKRPAAHRGIASLGLGLWVVFFSPQRIVAEVLTNAAQVLSLSAEQAAQQLPVHVRGVVTAAEPTWAGRFFIQDASSGVFVELISTNHPSAGDVVELTGVTMPGAYAPIITRPDWKKVGTAPLPPARPVPIEQIMSGIEDGQRVEVTGIVRSVTPEAGSWDVDLAAGGFRLHAFPKPLTNTDPTSLIGSRVRVRGTIAASFNATLRHLVTVALFVPFPADFVIEEREPANPFEEPALPLNSIAQYRRDLLPGKRVHVRGVVTLQRLGEDFFLEDKTGGLRVKTHQMESLKPGEVVEVVGFPEFDNFLPVLNDAVFHKSTETHAPISARAVSMQDIQAGLHHADLVKLRAKVLDRSFRPAQLVGHRAWRQTTLLLQDDDQLFTAEAESPQSDTTLADIPIGSLIEVAGVCFTQTGEDQHLRALQILLPAAGSVRLLSRPSWLTPRRLLMGLGLLFVVLMAAVVWTLMVSKRNKFLGQLILEKEKAQQELQQAHDHLEDRVKERTAQLKFQITARKEAEVQFNATLNERTRLAQELHDTLEQTLTGIALQLDTTSKLFQQKPAAASHHLELARDQVNQSQVEVRRSIWNLRSRALEEFDLPSALVSSSRQLTEGTPIQVQVTTAGRVRPLPETVEDNLLRIGQEAVTNVIKHSQATTVKIHLDYGPQNLVLAIQDNGRGFEPRHRPGPDAGHFGLLGISERAKRLNAGLTVESSPGAGTLVKIQVPLAVDQPQANAGI
jgi:signal transduction histidine kinase